MSEAGKTIYLNGDWVSHTEARLPIDERSTQFGDAVYEVVRFDGGRAFAMEGHQARMARSLEVVGIESDAAERMPAIAEGLLSRNGVRDGRVYWQVSRGAGERAFWPEGDEAAALSPTVIGTVAGRGVLTRGMAVPVKTGSVMRDERWGRCDVKTVMLLPAVLAAREAQTRGVDLAIWERDGIVTESCWANVMVVRDGEVWTHPLGRRILGGVTRAVLIELLRGDGVSVREEAFGVAVLLEADEVFVCGTTTLVTAVGRVDDRDYGGVGTVTTRAYGLLVDAILGG